MQKIPTIFVRDMSRQPALVTPEWHRDCAWVAAGEGIATRKYDGTCCMIRSGKLYRRRELRAGDSTPENFESTGTDETTGKTVGWVPVGNGPDDRWHREAFSASLGDGTYELLGPKIQGNKDGRKCHVLQAHSMARTYPDAQRDFEGLRAFLEVENIEGLVWHHPDGRMAKIKRKDFGIKW